MKHGRTATTILFVGALMVAAVPDTALASSTVPTACSWAAVTVPPTDKNATLDAVDAVARNDAWAVGTDGRNTRTDHWDGTAWSTVVSPNPGASINSIADVSMVSRDDVWGVGFSKEHYVGASHALTMHWDGSAWTTVVAPHVAVDSPLWAVDGSSSGDVWAVGEANDPDASNSLALHWDGVSWTEVATPRVGSVDSLQSLDVVGSEDVWAVGGTVVGGTYEPLSLHWDGVAWTPVPMPTMGEGQQIVFVGVAARSTDDVWAVGEWGWPTYNRLMEHWDGTDWTVVPQVEGEGWLTGITVLPDGDTWTVGRKGTAHTLALHLGQSGWERVSSEDPVPGATSRELMDVAGVSLRSLWAVGRVFEGSDYEPIIERFGCA